MDVLHGNVLNILDFDQTETFNRQRIWFPQKNRGSYRGIVSGLKSFRNMMNRIPPNDAKHLQRACLGGFVHSTLDHIFVVASPEIPHQRLASRKIE